MILEEAHVAGRLFSTDDFFRLREPTFRVPMHLSPDGQLLSLTIRSRSHGKLERDQSFTPEGIPGEMVGSRVLVIDTQALLVRQLRPGVAAVGRFVEAAAGPAAAEAVGRALRLPEGGVEDAGVVRVHGEVDGAGPLAAKEDLLPGGAAVARAIEPALLVRSPGVAQRRDVDQVGVVRVDADLGNVPGIGQAKSGSRPVAGGRFADA